MTLRKRTLNVSSGFFHVGLKEPPAGETRGPLKGPTLPTSAHCPPHSLIKAKNSEVTQPWKALNCGYLRGWIKCAFIFQAEHMTGGWVQRLVWFLGSSEPAYLAPTLPVSGGQRWQLQSTRYKAPLLSWKGDQHRNSAYSLPEVRSKCSQYCEHRTHGGPCSRTREQQGVPLPFPSLPPGRQLQTPFFWDEPRAATGGSEETPSESEEGACKYEPEK